jgi:hypothetical protein
VISASEDWYHVVGAEMKYCRLIGCKHFHMRCHYGSFLSTVHATTIQLSQIPNLRGLSSIIYFYDNCWYDHLDDHLDNNCWMPTVGMIIWMTTLITIVG